MKTFYKIVPSSGISHPNDEPFFTNAKNIFKFLHWGDNLHIIKISQKEIIPNIDGDKWSSSKKISLTNESFPLSDSSTFQLLINAGADVTIDNNSAIKFACKNGYLPIVQLLISAGADFFDCAPYAVTHCYLDIVEYLIQLGIDLSDHQLIILAAKCGKLPVIELLVKYGANPFALNNEPLIMATEYGHLSSVEYFIEKGAKISIRNNFLIRSAVDSGYIDLVKYLLKKGADIKSDSVPIKLASDNGNLPMLQLLISNGANPFISKGFALKAAKRNNHIEMIEYLSQIKKN